MVSAGVPEGMRDDSIFRFASSLRGRDIPFEDAKALVLEAASNCTPPFTEQEALKKLDQAWKYFPNEAERKANECKVSLRSQGYKASELFDMKFPKTVWIVDSLLTEGLSILAGKPKIGKSWLALDLATAVAEGRPVLGDHGTQKSDVLYLALEDSQRRMKSRLGIILQGRKGPANLYLVHSWPKIDEGGDRQLIGFLDDHPGVKLVIVDTLQKVREQGKGNKDQYAVDYAAMSGIKSIADECGISILVVHHLRKAGADDPWMRYQAPRVLLGRLTQSSP